MSSIDKTRIACTIATRRVFFMLPCLSATQPTEELLYERLRSPTSTKVGHAAILEMRNRKAECKKQQLLSLVKITNGQGALRTIFTLTSEHIFVFLNYSISSSCKLTFQISGDSQMQEKSQAFQFSLELHNETTKLQPSLPSLRRAGTKGKH